MVKERFLKNIMVIRSEIREKQPKLLLPRLNSKSVF